MSTTLIPPIVKNHPNYRLLGIDAVRYIGVFAIILIHTLAVKNTSYQIDAAAIITQLSRFAVPFFFISGGFFFGCKVTPRPLLAIKQISWRIGPLFLAWVIIYLLLLPNSIPSVITVKFIVSVIATGGPAYHLWFLPTFALCMMIVAFSTRYLRLNHLFMIAVILYLMGLLIGSYAGLLSASGQSTAVCLSIARGGPFFGTIFVLFGFWLARNDWRPSLAFSLMLLVTGVALQLTEAYLLNVKHMTQFATNDFLLGTLFFGGGTFLLALRLPSSNKLVTLAAALGKFTLGVFAIHLLIVLGFQALLDPTNIAAKLEVSVAVLTISTLVTLALARVKFTRFLVS